jgi:hypothetical protein
MKRKIIAILLIAAAAMLFAQQRGNEVGAPDPQMLGIESAQQMLKEISVEKFEYEGYWNSSMSSDEGYVSTRLFIGGPMAKEPVPEEKDLNIPDKYVLGTRVDFLRRGYSSFTIYPMRPIPIEGVTKTVSMWIAGRNYNHEIKVLLQDFFGKYYELYMGKLNFQGWKKLTVAIPPQGSNGTTGIVQQNYHYNNQMGIKIIGFRIDCDPMEAYGSYYIYFDDLRAITDLFAENNRDADDMSDGW